jgi:hypothetical protein
MNPVGGRPGDDKTFHVLPALTVRTKYRFDVQSALNWAHCELPATAVAEVALVRLMAVIEERSDALTVVQVRPLFADS